MGLDRAVTEVLNVGVSTPELTKVSDHSVLCGHLRFHGVLPEGESVAEFVGDGDHLGWLIHPFNDVEDSRVI